MLIVDEPDVPFYEKSIAWDVQCIPLIEPCYIVSTTGKDGYWMMMGERGSEIREIDMFFQGHYKYLDVVDSVIVGYNWREISGGSKRTWVIEVEGSEDKYVFETQKEFEMKLVELNGLNQKTKAYTDDVQLPPTKATIWYIEVPAEGKGYEYRSEQEFLTKLQDYSNKQPKFKELSVLYDELCKTGYLPWYPDEYKK